MGSFSCEARTVTTKGADGSLTAVFFLRDAIAGDGLKNDPRKQRLILTHDYWRLWMNSTMNYNESQWIRKWPVFVRLVHHWLDYLRNGRPSAEIVQLPMRWSQHSSCGLIESYLIWLGSSKNVLSACMSCHSWHIADALPNLQGFVPRLRPSDRPCVVRESRLMVSMSTSSGGVSLYRSK